MPQKPLWGMLAAHPEKDGSPHQIATKEYVDKAIGSGGTGEYLPLAGGAMLGPIEFEDGGWRISTRSFSLVFDASSLGTGDADLFYVPVLSLDKSLTKLNGKLAVMGDSDTSVSVASPVANSQRVAFVGMREIDNIRQM